MANPTKEMNLKFYFTLNSFAYGIYRQEYRSGLPFPSPGDLPDPGTDPGSPHCRQILYHLNHQGVHLNNHL